MSAMSRLRLPIAIIVATIFAAALAFAAFSVAFPSTAEATHNWAKYHWARTSNTFTLQLGDNVSDTTVSKWQTHLNTAAANPKAYVPSDNTTHDWTDSTVLDTKVVASGKDPTKCAPTSGRVEVCNAAYGSTGWLGLGQIWIKAPNHIYQGAAKVNDTYYNTGKYSDFSKQQVMCQEIGHTFGLAHTSEDGTSQDTCMDYAEPTDTRDQWPNQHDYNQLKTIYTHLDKTTTVSNTSAASTLPGAANRGDLNERAQWGQLQRRSQNGRLEIYERDFGRGNKLVTFVILADGEEDSSGEHDHSTHEH